MSCFFFLNENRLNNFDIQNTGKRKVDNILHSIIFGHNLNLCYFASVKTAITALLIIILVHTDFPFYRVESFGTQDLKGRRYDVTHKKQRRLKDAMEIE